MNARSRSVTALIVAAILLFVDAAIAVVFVVGAHVPIDPQSTAQGNTYLSLYVLLFGAFVMLGIFVVFLWIGVEDLRNRTPISALYWPQLAVKGTFSSYMTMLGLDVFDLLTHGLKPHWLFLYSPTAKLFQSVLLLAVFCSFAWVLIVILRGRAFARSIEGGLVGTVAQRLIREVDRLKTRVRAEEERSDASEARVDATTLSVDSHEERLDVVEEIVEVKRTTKKKAGGDVRPE